MKSIGHAISNDPEIRKIVARHPRFVAFVRSRISIDEKFGLYLTVGFFVTAVFLFFFLAALEDLLFQDPLIRADLRIINSLQLFRSPTFNEVMLLITYLGNWQVLLSAVLAASLFLASMRRWYDISALVLSMSGGMLLVWLLKHLVHRPRPDLLNALAHAQGYSFPSGHSFYAFTFYGLLGYFVLREAKRPVLKSLILITTVCIIGAIGFSRIYLGVHWPSDVLAGYASGAAWLTVVITAIEIRRKYYISGYADQPSRRLRMVTVGLCLFSLWGGYAGYFFVTNPLKPVTIAEQRYTVAKQDVPQKLFTSLSRSSEDLIGEPMEPINLIIVASKEKLAQTFTNAGWSLTDPVSFRNFRHLVGAYIFDEPYTQAPGIPTYWNSRPNDFAYAKPTPANTIGERYHVHFWDTPFILKDKRKIWFCTAHFDKIVNLRAKTAYLPIHKIDPVLDRVREKIKEDLSITGNVESIGSYQIVEPMFGANRAGDNFFTDGKAYVVFLKY